jgi:hypothetical protein
MGKLEGWANKLLQAMRETRAPEQWRWSAT